MVTLTRPNSQMATQAGAGPPTNLLMPSWYMLSADVQLPRSSM